MALRENWQAAAIAAEWDVEVALLEDSEWEIDTIDGNDGEVYGYLIRFADDTDPKTLEKLGFDPGEFTRQVSINVFDEPDPEYEDWKEPGRDEDYKPLQEDYSRTTSTRRDPTPFGEASIAEAGRSNFFPDSDSSNFAFVPDGSRTITATLATGESVSITDDKGNRLIIGESVDSVEMLRREMLERMDRLEAVLRQNLNVSPNRGHNRPPELLKIEQLVPQAQMEDLAKALTEIRNQANAMLPNQEIVIDKVSTLQRFGAWLADASGNGVVGVVAAVAYEKRQELFTAVMSAADAAMAWAHQLPALY